MCNDNQYCGLLFVLDKTDDYTKEYFSDISKVSFYKKVNDKEIPLKKVVNKISDTSNKFIGLSISKNDYSNIITGKLETFYLKTPNKTLKIELKATFSKLETTQNTVLNVERIYINGVSPRDAKTDFYFHYEFLLEDYKVTE